MFSWEKPIEQEILEFVRSMKEQMLNVVHNGQSEVKEGAENYAKAYETVERHIVQEIKLREGLTTPISECGRLTTPTTSA